MNNFKMLYRILKVLEKSMDISEFDEGLISHEQLGITRERWLCCLHMLLEEGLVSGVEITSSILGETTVGFYRPKIKLKGLQYLEENSLMRKVADTAKGIKNIVPGI